MSKQVKIRRGTSAQHASFTGVEGEITVDTTLDTVRVHDGATAGGRQLLRADLTNIGGTLGVANGGTGATTLTGVLVGNGTSAVTTKTNPSGAFVGTTDAQTLTNKTLTSPTINGGTISGITDLAIADGGTGASTAAAAFANIVTTASSLSDPGYIRLANGLYVMWGSFTAAQNASTTYNYSSISGSISLTTFSIAVVSGGIFSFGQQDNGTHTSSCSTTGFTVVNAIDSPATTFFIAIGY